MATAQDVGVLTFHRCINCGSYWQARCLVEGLRTWAKNPVLLDHDSAALNRAEWRCALQPLLPVRSPRSAVPLYATKVRRFLRAVSGLPSTRRFSLESPPAFDELDLVVVGSDEVWNPRHPWYGRPRHLLRRRPRHEKACVLCGQLLLAHERSR